MYATSMSVYCLRCERTHCQAFQAAKAPLTSLQSNCVQNEYFEHYEHGDGKQGNNNNNKMNEKKQNYNQYIT